MRELGRSGDGKAGTNMTVPMWEMEAEVVMC